MINERGPRVTGSFDADVAVHNVQKGGGRIQRPSVWPDGCRHM